MDPWEIVLAAWLPVAGIVLALCLSEADERSEPAMLRPKVNPNPADEG